MTLLFESFGYKKGTPADADYVFDVRCLPNPHWQPSCDPSPGATRRWLRSSNATTEVQQMFDELRGLLERWLPALRPSGAAT